MEMETSTSNKCIRLELSRRMCMGSHGWGALINWRLHFVKLIAGKATALVQVSDQSGTASLFFEGDVVRHLFKVDEIRWKQIISMAGSGELFYRPFKNGLNDSFPISQQLFYKFCETQQIKDLLFVSFTRVPNMRKGEKTIPFLKITKCTRSSPQLLKAYEQMYLELDRD